MEETTAARGGNTPLAYETPRPAAPSGWCPHHWPPIVLSLIANAASLALGCVLAWRIYGALTCTNGENWDALFLVLLGFPLFVGQLLLFGLSAMIALKDRVLPLRRAVTTIIMATALFGFIPPLVALMLK